MAVKFEQIKPRPMNTNAMMDRIRKGVKAQAGHSNKQFGLTYSTWKHKPEFEETFEESKGEMVGSALTSGDGSSDNPYPFVTKGTAVRYATMTDNFSPKSKVKVIGSSGGRGGLLYVDKSRPRPGIKAREFEEEIAKREQPKFKKRMEKSIGEAAKASGHKI